LVSALADLRVCVIHGDGDMRRTIREELNVLGVNQIRECTDPSMALLLLAEFEADFCIVDWQGEPMDGLEFVTFIRTSDESPDPKLPIIMLTNNASTHHVIDARNAGADEFLAQPITRRALHARLLALIENPMLFIQSDDYRGPDRRQLRRSFVGTHQRESDAAAQDTQSTSANTGKKERLAG
jgi:two-component system, chemotaxis family, chemotaxis protein CheY